MNADEIRAWLVDRIARASGLNPSEIDVREPFESYGLSSTDAVVLSGDLQKQLGRELSPTLTYEYPSIAALSQHLGCAIVTTGREDVPDTGAANVHDAVAIVGMACRFPGAHDPPAFWQLLREGRDMIREVPRDRWDAREYYDPDASVPGKSITQWGGFLDGVDRFDPFFFGISAGEAERMDPQQRLLLELAYEGFEDASYQMGRLARTDTGVFVGISINEYGWRQFDRHELITGHSGTGNALSIAANRISYFFDLRGPSLAVDTACSSSLMAVHLACRSLRSRECELAIAGGVNIILSPAHSIAFTKAGVLAPDGRCKAFDARANGFVRGEGGALVVLKPLRKALEDRDPIYALVRGSAVGQDGRTNGLMAPNPDAQAAVLRAAYRDAGVSPGRVQYVEAHGTGTLLGDAMEARALGAVLSDDRTDGPCALGTVKSNLGHLEAAAGVAGLVKVALALKHRAIPPSLHFETPNPQVRFDALDLRVQQAFEPWPDRAGAALAGVSSFGFGGTNVHLVVEEAPGQTPGLDSGPEGAEPRSSEWLLFSADRPDALRAVARSFRDFVAAHECDALVSLRDICAAAAVRKNHLDCRAAVVARSKRELVDGLDGFLRGENRPDVVLPPDEGMERAVEWYRNHSAGGRGVSLPSYPWQRERFWIDSAIHGPLHSNNGAHPLLGKRVVVAQDPGACEWRADLDPHAMFLRDHRVNGEVVVPASAYVEMALSAAADAGLAGHHALGDLEFSRRLVLQSGESRSLRVTLSPEIEGRRSLGVHSRVREVEREEWTLHASASLIQMPDVRRPEPASVASIKEACGQQLRPEDLYRSLAQRGLEYGPSLRAIAGIWRRDGEALGRVVLPAPLVPDMDAYEIHPILLDAAMHVVAAALDGSSPGGGTDGTFLPFGCRRVTMYQRPGPSLWSHVILRSDAGAGPVEADVRLLDESGYCIGEVDGLRLVRSAQERRHAAAPVQDTWLYGVRWQHVDWPLTEAARGPSSDGGRRWIILGDRHGLAESLKRRLEARGDRCRIIACDSSAADPNDGDVVWDEHDAGIRALIDAELDAEPSRVHGVIHLWSAEPEAVSTGQVSLRKAQTLGCNAVLSLVQRLVANSAVLGTPRVWLVTRGAQPVEPGQPVSVSQAPLWGLGKSIAFELPDFRCTLVDLEPALDSQAASDFLVRELQGTDFEDQVALRDGRRFVPRLLPHALADTFTSCPNGAPGALRADGSYLIAGGLGGLGLAVAEWMVAEGARHLALAGRRPPSAAASRAVNAMRQAGADVTVLTADIADSAQVTDVLERMRATMPPLRGIVHAAGVLDDGAVVDLDDKRMSRVLAPKVDGAWNLHALTKRDPLDFFVLFSSAVSVLGSPGQGNYAAANSFLDALAHERHSEKLPAISINWGPWAEIGLAADGISVSAPGSSGAGGIRGIDPRRGLELLGRALRDSSPQLTVLPFDLASLLDLYPTAARMPFFADVGGKDTHVSRLYARPTLLQPYVAPRNEIERRLAELWRQTLRIDRVGVRDSFFELGGDSVLAAQLVTASHRTFGVGLDLREAFESFTIEDLARQVEAASSLPIVPSSRAGGPIPLSFVQERQLFLELIDPSTAVNNLATCVRLDGPLDLPTLERSANRVLARHDVLRSSFEIGRGRPTARIAPVGTTTVELVDLEHRTGEALAETLRLAELEARRPFDVTRPLLLRTKMFRLAEDTHVLLIVVHHTIGDGWSLGVFLRELFAGYQAITTGQSAVLPPLSIQYADFALWQRESIDGPGLERQRQFWKDRLAGELPVLDLPIDRPRSARQTFAGGTVRFRLPASVMDGVKAVSRQHNATPFMTLAAAVKALLHRVSGQDDVLIGTPTAGRTRPETEDLIGPFINTLVLRTDLSGDPSFGTLLNRVREVALSAYAHQDLPFEKLVAELRLQRDLSRTPIFQVNFVFHNTPALPVDVPGLAMQWLMIDRGVAQFDLTVTLIEREDGLEGAFDYNTDLFDEPTVERLSRGFRLLLEDAVAHPDERVSRLAIMTGAERHRVVNELNDTSAEFPRDRSVHELFEAQVERTPEAVALVCDGTSLTYRDLDAWASNLAGELQRAGVGPDARVGVYLERSLELVVALLAVLKAGGAYVPIDPATPAERMQFVLDDAGACVLVTDESLNPAASIDVVVVRRPGRADLDDWHARPPIQRRAVRSGNLAYVIYTSGSTGQPKGVLVPHLALTNLLWSMRDLLDVGQGDTLLAVTSVGFDIAALELFLPLIAGGTVVLATREMTMDRRKLQAAIVSHGVKVMQATPAMWRMMLQGGWRGDRNLMALCGGEPLTAELAEQLMDRVGTVWNLYGPTETTVWSAAGRVERDQRPITIGRPIANTQLYVLDAHLQPLPAGATGEVYIGGAGVALGYLNQPDLTRERFIANPFDAETGKESRLFRTGDLGRYLADGRIEIIGRSDDQVKVNGFRIELGEIESALNRCPPVRESVVVARENAHGGKHLVAYIVPAREPGPPAPELRRLLRSMLPAYMVPAVFVSLPRLPLTPAGKIDRRALPAPPAAPAGAAFAAAGTPLEKALAAIYAQVLGLEAVSIDENFFDLGGGSIQILEIIARAEDHGLELGPEAFFEHQTVSALAAFLGDAPIQSGASAGTEHV